ncbi:MAG TPA: alpha/beta hydrolase [Ilumatobacter sp.]
MSTPASRAAAPKRLLRVMESRAVFELGAVAAASPLLRIVGRGDNHPVLILPGFLAGDSSTLPLRSILQSQGYWVHGWRLGRNLGPTADIVEGLVERLDELHERHDRPVSLIGWSLGGIYARRLARAWPGKVRQVITLGSPFRINPTDRSAASALFDRLQPTHAIGIDELLPPSGAGPLPVPTTAIYTKTDGVVRWWQCIEQVSATAENIEVLGSHSGLGFNPAAIYAISDRLAQPADDWRPFRPPAFSRSFFPHPADWRPELADELAGALG